MKCKSKKIISLLLAMIIGLSLSISVYAATSTKTFSVSTALGPNSMMIQGWEGNTYDSNAVYFNVNLKNKTIKSITVQVGSSTSSGVIIGNTMQLENTTTGKSGSVAWSGGNKTSVTYNAKNSNFIGTDTEGIYKLWYTGTVIGNTSGNPIFNIPESEAIRGYKGSEIKLIIEYA